MSVQKGGANKAQIMPPSLKRSLMLNFVGGILVKLTARAWVQVGLTQQAGCYVSRKIFRVFPKVIHGLKLFMA